MKVSLVEFGLRITPHASAGGQGLGVVVGPPLPGLTLALTPLPQNFKTVVLSVFPFPDHK